MRVDQTLYWDNEQVWHTGNLTNLNQLTNGPAYITTSALSGYATQTYVNTAVSNLVASAPSTLDTLNELATALGNDANFATTITTSIGNKVSKSGDTMTGNLAFGATSGLGLTWGLNTDAAFIKFISTGNQAGGSYLEIGTQDDSNEEIKFTQSGVLKFYLATDGNLKTGSGYNYVWENGTWAIGISGNAATATNVAWTGVTGRPTALSQFSNDLGNYGGWLTQAAADPLYVNVTGDTMTGPLVITGSTSGQELFAVNGVNGRLFTVSDDLSNSLFSVNTVAGLPVIEAFANNTVNIGPFSAPIVINASGISTPSHGTSANWNSAYNDTITSAAVSGTTSKTLTLTQRDGGTVTATWTDIDTDTNTDAQTLSVSGSTLTISGGNSITLPTSGISQATADGLYVNISGDEMTGNLYISPISANPAQIQLAGSNPELYVSAKTGTARVFISREGTGHQATLMFMTAMGTYQGTAWDYTGAPMWSMGMTNNANTNSFKLGYGDIYDPTVVALEITTANTAYFKYVPYAAGNLLATQSWVTSQGYITGYTETDTLNSVTGRGASTTNNITIGGLTSNGVGVFNSTNDTQISLRSTNTWSGIEFDDSGTPDYIWYNGGNQTFSIGGGGGNVSGKKLHVHGGVTIGSSYTATSVTTNGLAVEGAISASNFSGSSSGTNTGDQTNISGNAATAGYSDEAKWISFLDGPRDLSDRLPNWNNRSVAWDFVGAGIANGSGNYGGVMTFSPWDGTSGSTGDSSYQLAFANNTGVNASGQPKLSIRNGINSTWNAWYTLIHSGNIGSQTVATAGALTSMNISQFTNNSGYITSYSETDTLYSVTNRGNTLIQDIEFTNGRKGLVGRYDAAQTQAIFAMGSNYTLADGAASSQIGPLYGLAWSYNPNYGGAGNNPQSIAGLNHQLLLMQNGITTAAMGSGIWTSGNISAANFSGSSSGTNTGDQTNISGNAATATNAIAATNISLTSLGNATVNVSNGSSAVYRNENGSGGNLSYAPVLHVGGGDTMWQIQGDYYDSSTLKWRAGYNGTWYTWRTIIHSGNIGSQTVATAGALSSMNISQFTNNSGYITGYTETDTLASVTARGASTTAAITTGVLTVNTGGAGTWGQFVVNSTSLWGDGGTLYTTIGAGGAAGIMIYNPHIVWNAGDSAAIIKLGRSGGVSGGAYYVMGTGASDNFLISKNGITSPQLNINSSGNATFSGTVSASNLSGTNTGDQTNISGNAATATNVAWTGVTSRPTALSQFTNDLGNYGGWITGYTETIGTNNTSGVAGAKYQINDTWLRVNSDNRQFQTYGNTRSIIYRTDGITNDHGGGNYPYIFYYGGSTDGERLVIFETNGDIWMRWAGDWLSTLLNAKSNTGHTHDDRYYTETEVNNFFSGATAITGYNKSNWDVAYNKRPTAISFSGTGTKTLTLTQGDGSTLTANFSDIDTDTNTDGQTLSISGSTLTISGGNSITLPTSGISQGTADSLYVNVSGDTMTGPLAISGVTSGQELFAVNGVNGRLFTVVDDLTDSLYSVNTLAGLPVLEVFANNVVQIGKFGTNAIYVGQDGRVGFGTTDFSYTTSDTAGSTGTPNANRVFVNGSVQLIGSNDGFVVGRSGASFFKDEEIAFGWGGGWFMQDATYLRVRGNKMVYSGGSARFDGNIFVGNETYYLYGDSPNAGIRTNGSFLVNGDIYFGTRGTWLSSYLNQAVLTTSDSTFNSVYFANGNLRLYQGDGTALRVVTAYGWMNLGAQNGTWTHMYASQAFYFNQNLYVNGTQVVTNSGTWSINVSGNAATATNVAYSGLTGTVPTWNQNTTGTSSNITAYTINQSVGTGNSPTFQDVYADNWFRNNNNLEGLYNQANGTHFYSRSAAKWGITGSGGNIHLEFRSNHESTLRGVVYADTSNQIGFLNNGEGWAFRTNSSNNAFVHGTDLTINADGAGSSNINMNDGDEGNRIIHCNSNRIGFLTQAGSWGAYCDDSGNWAAANFSGSSSGTNTGDVTETLTTVTGRGNTTTTSMGIGSNSIPNGKLYVNGGSVTDVIAIQNTLNTGAYLVFADNVTPTWANAPRLGAISNDMVFKTLDTERFRISSTGASTFSSTISASNFSGSSSGTNTGDQTNISGNAATATNVAWTGVTGRPTALSQFTNDLSLGGAVVTIQDSAPAGTAGQLWWESDTGKLKVYYSSAWVDATPVPDMSLYYAKAGGSIDGDVTIRQTLTVVGNTLIQGVLTETSDISLKENILPLESSLDKLMKLNGVSFNKKTTPHVKEIGFIAQEVEEIIPDLVTETSDGIKTVAYSRVSAILVETIKEQQTQITELKEMVNILTKKINDL
jgi:hypothetical protein